jgi:insertion element IS1 protein InsB
VNEPLLRVLYPENVEVEVCRAEELDRRRGLTSELDEMWSYVRCKANPRWLWHAIDHHTGQVLAYVFGRRQDDVFLKLQQLLAPFGITKLSSIRWARRTRRKSRANTLISGPGSSDSYAAHCASPRRSTCTIS